MSTAVISDIHGNAEALRSVLADIDSRKVDRIICLGDIVGYGPEPLECVDLIRTRCQWSLMGNHDFAVLYEPTNFNQDAESAAYWTRDRFDHEPDDQLRTERYQFLGRLRVRVLETLPDNGSSVLAVHGSPRRPINEYIFATDPRMYPDKIRAVFDRVERLAIVGHTHVPGVFTDEPDFYPPDELGEERSYSFRDDEKAVINVGSVGQPRDGNPNACYVILHHNRAEFVRVPYNVDVTARKIRSIPELNDRLANRLYEGQ
ncbi:MAG: metallophosphoesterase family protein [Phycisphaeraceae bacterium]|nr:metallophosphoesterase family protein [Phycisphaerae bacterium]MBX3393138.1 metallophosphoesterase family protein [Phycisphaeraceae bacterium]HRJ49129.1 metallophosphoesterase family protein [Phycisphaerales bacterium]